MHGHRLQGVGRAGGVVAADLAVERADQRSGRPAAGRSAGTSSRSLAAGTGQVQPPSAVSRSAPSSAYDARGRRPAAPGPRARPSPGATSSRSRARWRSRRLTRLRVTALPDRLADHEADPGRGPRPGRVGTRCHRCTTRVRAPARRPRRTAVAKPADVVSRCAVKHGATRDRMRPPLRRRGCCDPCGDARTGSSDRRGCASAGGSRAPCDDDGCSAGTYACSRADLRTVRW